MSAGRIMAEGTPATLGGRDTARARIRFELPAGGTIADLPVTAVPDQDGLVAVDCTEPTGTLHQLTDWALRRGSVLARLTVDRPSLEDVYLQLTGENVPERPLVRSAS
jgi:ABC-2 type transport system ATP-binding protein